MPLSRRSLFICLLFALSLLLANCGGGSGTSSSMQTPPPQGATFSVTIGGLPSGTSGQVAVTGPGGYTSTLAQTTTLTNLTPGTYTVTATIVPSVSASNTVYVPTVAGSPATVSVNTGAAATVSYSQLVANWNAIGPTAIGNPLGLPAAGKLQALAVSNANPSLMYAGGGIGPGNSGPYSEAGIYMTTNGGNTWNQENTGLTDPTVNVLWLDQSNTNIVVAGTNSTGIFQSTNGGANWSLTGAFGSTSAFLQVSGTLYAATAQGIVTSTDNGATWSVLLLTSAPVRALAAEGGVTFAGLDNGQVMIQSTSSGPWTTTTPTTSGTVWSIALNPTNSQNDLVVDWGFGYQNPSLYGTENEGGLWTTVTSTSSCPSPSPPAQFIAYDPNTSILYVGCDYETSQSLDNGNTWTQVPGANWDVRLITTEFAGVVGNIAVGSDQGVYLSKNSGSTWQGLNGNITSSILYGVGVQGLTILTAVQDFSPISSFDGGKTWSNLETGAAVGESGTVLFNPGNPQYAYFFTTAGFYYSSNGGQTFTSVRILTGVGGEFNPSSGNGDLIAVDPSSPSTVYVAAVSGVYKSTDWGASWTRQSSWPVSGPVMAAVSPANGNGQTIFVGDSDGSLWFTLDGGSSWATSNLGNTCGSPVALAVSPANPQNILVAMTGFASCGGGILRSTDGGANFSPANAGLSSRQAQCQAAPIPHLHLDPAASGVVAAATPGGVYISSDFGLNWTSIRGNTVPLSVTEAIWSGGYLYASTCGEGVLQIPFAF